MQGPFAKNASWQLAACLCTLRLPCHGPSWLLFALPCSFKSEENARTIRQKVLRPPAGTLRGPTCSFTCVLQVKLALGLKNPQFLQQLLEGPKGPPGGPQEASKRPPCSHAPKRPPRGPQEAPKSQNLRMVLTFSTFLERQFFGIRYGGFCTLGSKTHPSVLQSGENARTIR